MIAYRKAGHALVGIDNSLDATTVDAALNGNYGVEFMTGAGAHIAVSDGRSTRTSFEDAGPSVWKAA